VDFVSPERERIHSAMRVQKKPSVQNVAHFCTFEFSSVRPFAQSSQVDTRSFRCLFYEIPYASYDDADGLPEHPFSLDEPEIKVHHGTLTVDLSKSSMEKGAFKTSHPGMIKLDDETTLSPFTNGRVCVKQMYQKRPNDDMIRRAIGRHDLGAFSVECNCHRWASILLDLTYKFIAREINTRGEPPFHIPKLRFTHVMIAIVQDTSIEKTFLIEEWIYPDEKECPFTKYIDNRIPAPCVPFLSSPRVHEIAEFLAFAQHVQWTKSHFSAFTSDFQGAGSLLTDPQITSNPFVSISKLKFITLIYSTEILGQIYLETATWRALSSTSARIIPAIVSAGSLV